MSDSTKLPILIWTELFGMEPCYPLQELAEDLHCKTYGRPPECLPCPCGECGESFSVFSEEFARLVTDSFVSLVEAAEMLAENESKQRHPSNRGGAR